MSENNDSVNNVDSENLDSTNQDNENTNSDKKVPLATFLKERKERQETEKRLVALEKQLEDDKNKKLVEQNEFKSLYETEKQKNAEKDKEIELLKQKAEQWDAYNSNKREGIKKKLGEKYLPSFDNVALEDLEKTASLLLSKETPDTESGASGKPGETNPFSRKTFNMTKQIEIKRKDPALAKRLEEQANRE